MYNKQPAKLLSSHNSTNIELKSRSERNAI